MLLDQVSYYNKQDAMCGADHITMSSMVITDLTTHEISLWLQFCCNVQSVLCFSPLVLMPKSTLA